VNGFAGPRGDLAQQVADGADAVDRLFAQLHAGLLADLQGPGHPSKRIDVQIELRARLGRKPPVRIALSEQPPDAHRRRIFEQRAILIRHLLGRDRPHGPLILALPAPPRPLVAFIQDVPPELAEPRVLQRFAAYSVVRDSLVGRQASRSLLDRLAYRFANVAMMADLIHLRHDHRDEPAVLLQNPDLTDPGVLQVGCFDGLWLDVLAARGHDQGRDPARDVQVTVIIEVAEVPGAKPSVLIEDLASLFWSVAVAGEDVRPPGDDLTFPARRACPDSILGFRRHSRGVDPDLDTRYRASDAAELPPVGRVERQERGGLGEAVTDGDTPPQALQCRREVRVQGRTTGGDYPQSRTEPSAKGKQRNPAGVDPGQATQPDAKPDDTSEKGSRETPARSHSLLYPRIQRTVEPRDADDQGRLPFSKGAHKLRTRQGLGQDYWQTGRQRRKHSHDERIDVVQRQRQQDPIVL